MPAAGWTASARRLLGPARGAAQRDAAVPVVCAGRRIYGAAPGADVAGTSPFAARRLEVALVARAPHAGPIRRGPATPPPPGPAPTAGAPSTGGGTAEPGELRWVRLGEGPGAAGGRPPRSSRRILWQFVLANVLAVSVLLVASVAASRLAARSEALVDARITTDLLSTLVVEPALSAGVLAGDPGAQASFGAAVSSRMRAAGVVRIKIWTADGTIVWSDEPRLIGTSWQLGDDEQAALVQGGTHAETSDLGRPENAYERDLGAELLEVYGWFAGPSGEPLLLEIYLPHAEVNARQWEILVGFAPISIVVLLLLVVTQVPLARRMIRQLQAGEADRLRLLRRAADASTDERRRLAGTLHDGIVQDLAAASFVVAGEVDRLRACPAEAERAGTVQALDEASVAVRNSVAALRSLLVEIYPAHLARAGLGAALADLAGRLGPRGVSVEVHVDEGHEPGPPAAALIFRVAQEALINVSKHARASRVTVTVRALADGTRLEVADDGIGFRWDEAREAVAQGHFGLRVLSDLAVDAGSTLDLATAPGAGTRLLLTVPR